MNRKPAAYVIAATLGQDINELADNRYQSTRTSRAIYSFDDRYFAVGKRAPKDKVGGVWRPHTDQFWAAKGNTILWVCNIVT